MTTFQLDKRLVNDCYILGKLDGSYLLLLDNAQLAWFILVPETDKTEFHHLNETQQLALLKNINQLSSFIENNFTISKINTACIGNIVRQMHIHIIGRHESDACWPGVVWGQLEPHPYTFAQVKHIAGLVSQSLGEHFDAVELTTKS